MIRRQSELAQTGQIIEDYAELTDTDERGHDWAPVHRWAVVLDDGRVFAATNDLTADPGTRGSGPVEDGLWPVEHQTRGRDPGTA